MSITHTMQPDNTAPWHHLAIEEAVRRLESDAARGLTSSAVESRLAQHGRNELQERSGRSALGIAIEQFRGPMILLLASAAVISAVLHEYVDSIAILAIIVLNAILGFFQDFRAERAMAALKQLSVPTVKVHRDGALREISAAELVPGDVVELETGNRVPADCRLLQAANLEIDEAPLTGESESVRKQIAPLDNEQLPVADRINMAYLGTTVSYGHGIGLVTGTGMATELGRIADSLQTVKAAPSPLQRRLGGLGRTLAIVAIGIVLLLFVVGLLLGESPRVMLLTALSLAVAIVPEGLPAVATVTLALGARRMARRNALIRRLPAVEALGSVTVICSDKTGTLTENRMAVTVLDVADGRRSITPEECDSDQQSPQNSGHTLLLAAATLCNDSQLQPIAATEEITAIGEPTEAAIVVAAAKCGLTKDNLDRSWPRVDEIPFDSDRKCMTTVHDRPNSDTEEDPWPQLHTTLEPPSESAQLVCTKGAVDALLTRSAFVWTGGAATPLDDEWQERILRAHNELAGDGMRVLAAACRWTDGADEDHETLEQNLIFIGLLAMIDPPRAEARESVERCRTAGIRPVMITGDHALTAHAIARDLGISADDSASGVVSKVADGTWDHSTSVFARVSPHDKLEIVKALQADGEIVAMTGDGVNDAPAIKQADIGVAMGRIGTDVAREAADMVLLDDNFATIVNAVEEGRVVYDNIRKFVKYTMTSNAGELFVMFFGPLLGMPLPLLPLQILWINLVTDGLPGLALAVEPAEPGTMRRPPYPPSRPIFDREMVTDIIWIGLLMAVASLALGYWEWRGDPDNTAHWRTIVFTVLTISQMGNALATRSKGKTLFNAGIFSNKLMLGSVLLTLGLQLAVIYWGPMQSVFRTVPLSAFDLLMCAVLASIVFHAVELTKLFSRRKRQLRPEGVASRKANAN